MRAFILPSLVSAQQCSTYSSHCTTSDFENGALDQVLVQVLLISRCLFCADVWVTGLVRAQAAAVLEMERRLLLMEELASRISGVESEQDRSLCHRGRPQRLRRRTLQVVIFLIIIADSFSLNSALMTAVVMFLDMLIHTGLWVDSCRILNKVVSLPCVTLPDTI